MNDNNGRTHEPSHRELVVELDGLRQLVEERDRLYKERDESRKAAVDAALTAVKEQTRQAFEASEKARDKVESTQHEYNVAHNDIARKGELYAKETLSQCKDMIAILREDMSEKIDDLRQSRSVGRGKEQQVSVGSDHTRWLVTTLISVLSGLAGALTAAGIVISFQGN